MSTLSPIDLAWVNAKLVTYPIRYTEIYNEITDHVISAIEDARAAGDERDIELVFNEVMAFHFPSDEAIYKIVLQYVHAFNRKIRQQMWANFAYYLSWPGILLVIIIIAASLYLPYSKVIAFVFGILLIILAAIPQWYSFFKLPPVRKIRVDSSKSAFEPGNLVKQSLTRSFVQSRSGSLMWIVLVHDCVLGGFARMYNIDFLNKLHYPIPLYMALVAAFTIYGLSCMRLCRQKFKIADYQNCNLV